MPGLIEPSPASEASESNWRPVLLGIVFVVIAVGIVAWLLRSGPQRAAAPHPYAENLKFSDLKMSAAQNFVGATVTYLDGTITNNGPKTVTHVTVQVVFKDEMGQLAQREEVPLHVLQTSGPYPDVVDLANAPLASTQSRQFRLTFEHVTADWNQQYPELQVLDVTTK